MRPTAQSTRTHARAPCFAKACQRAPVTGNVPHSFVMPSEEHLSKVDGIGAILGVIVLLVATMLHPLGAHPGDAPAAFAEYALDRH
jgi:hypothetical protein